MLFAPVKGRNRRYIQSHYCKKAQIPRDRPDQRLSR